MICKLYLKKAVKIKEVKLNSALNNPVIHGKQY